MAFAALMAATAFASGSDDITAVSSRVSSDYVRARQADGSFAPETYAFAKGGAWKGAMTDTSIDKLTFLDVAHVIAYPLASQNYIPSKDPNAARLIILVYWGTTRTPGRANESPTYTNLQIAQDAVNAATMQHLGSQAMGSLQDELTTAIAAVAAENRIRENEDYINVRMLGYDSWWDSSAGEHRGTALEIRRQDLLSEIEEERYFVVLMAYDFQLLWKEKKHKLLWETRFSIRQRSHEFDKDLPAMAQYASQFFGKDSHGLLHTEVPLGRVDIGEVKTLGDVPGK